MKQRFVALGQHGKLQAKCPVSMVIMWCLDTADVYPWGCRDKEVTKIP